MRLFGKSLQSFMHFGGQRWLDVSGCLSNASSSLEKKTTQWCQSRPSASVMRAKVRYSVKEDLTIRTFIDGYGIYVPTIN